MRILSVIFFLVAFGCNSGAQNNASLNVDEFEKGLSNKDVQLLDVRTAGEFRNGHIKGSLQANWNNQQEFSDRIASLDKNKPVYVYCLSGGRSHAAADWMLENGFKNVVNMNGGLNSWKRNGKPVEGIPDVKQMTMEEYNQQIAGKEYVLVDFGAEWCPPCKKMEPVINEFLATNKQIFFLKIDGGIHTDLMKQLNAEVLPTFLLLKNGSEVWRYSGVLSAEELNKVWAEKK